MEEINNNAIPEEQLIPEEQDETKKKSLKKKIISIVVSVVLALALVGCVSVIAQVLSKGYVSIANYSMFRVVTGSMEPAIGVDELIIVKAEDGYEVGDIASVMDGDLDEFMNAYLRAKGNFIK